MTERERLEKLVYGALEESLRSGRPVVTCVADAVEKAQQAAPVPAEPPVWPGLEGKGLERAMEAYRTAYLRVIEPGPYNDARLRAGYTAGAAYLWRAMVASMPAYISVGSDRVRVGYDVVYRTALAALADPYDGGAK